MKIRALLPPEAIIVRADVQTKEAAIDLLAELHDQVGHLSDKEAYERDVWKREGECVTAIGMGMAVPHAKSDAVKQAGLAAITVPDGIDCRALDGQPTRLLFKIAAQTTATCFAEKEGAVKWYPDRLRSSIGTVFI